MLKQRIFTALLLLPLVLAAIFFLPALWFILLLWVIMLACTFEYVRLAGYSGAAATSAFILTQTAIFVFFYLSDAFWSTNSSIIFAVFVAAWLLLFIRLLLFRSDTKIDRRYRTLSFVTALVSVTTGWFALCWLRIQVQGPWLILLLLLIVWAADTGAYFAGKAFGKRKLAPHISPGKTIAGLIGGLILATFVGWLAVQLIPLPFISTVGILALSMITVLVSVGGDLMVSMHKRISGFKDSGNILPGHGGILDRIDSLLAAAPMFAFGLHLAAS
jgi:phosphatidate cytidylyltransferase